MSEEQRLACAHTRVAAGRWARSLTSGWTGVLLGLLVLVLTAKLAGGLAFVLALATAIAFPVIFGALVERTAKGGAVTLRPGGLLVESGRSRVWVRRHDVQGGYEQPEAKSAVLVLRGGGEVEIGADDVDGILTHMGVAPAQRAITFPLRATIGSGTWKFIGSVAGFLMGLVTAGALGLSYPAPMLTSIAFAVAFAVGLSRWLGRPRATVGVDGIAIHGALGRRFIPHAAIEEVHARTVSSHLVVTTRDRELTLPLYGQPASTIEALALRIERAAAIQRTGRARPVAQLARGGREIGAWRDDLRRVASRETGFRESALGGEDLARVLADASAPRAERIGAALALRVADPEAAPARIRVAIDNAADDALRAGLEAALAEDEAALDEATRDGR